MPSEHRATIAQTPEDIARIARIADASPERFVVQDGRRLGEVNVSAVYRHALAVTVGDEERVDAEDDGHG